MEATARATVDAPIEEVWSYLSTVEHLPVWVEAAGDVRRPDDGDLTVGSRFSSDFDYRGETFDVEYEVTALDPPRRMDVRWADGPFPFWSSLRLTEVAGRTEVHYTVDAGSDSRATAIIFALLGPVLRRPMRRQLAANLDRLATAVTADSEKTQA